MGHILVSLETCLTIPSKNADRLLALSTNSDDKISNGDSSASSSQNGLDRSDKVCELIDHGKKMETLLPLEGQVDEGFWPPPRVVGTQDNEDTTVILKPSIENQSELESIKKVEGNKNEKNEVENPEDECDRYRLVPAERTRKKLGSIYLPEQSAPSLDDERPAFMFSRIMPVHYDETSMYPFTNHPSQGAASSLLIGGSSLDEYGVKVLSLYHYFQQSSLVDSIAAVGFFTCTDNSRSHMRMCIRSKTWPFKGWHKNLQRFESPSQCRK